MSITESLRKNLAENENFDLGQFTTNLNKEFGFNYALEDLKLLKKVASQTTEEQFSNYLLKQDIDSLPAMKLSVKEMEMVKGGWVWGALRMAIGSASQGFAFRMGLNSLENKDITKGPVLS